MPITVSWVEDGVVLVGEDELTLADSLDGDFSNGGASYMAGGAVEWMAVWELDRGRPPFGTDDDGALSKAKR